MGRNKMSHGTSEISCLRKKLEEREKEITEKDEELAKKDEELAKKDEELAKKDEEIAKMKQELAESERKRSEPKRFCKSDEQEDCESDTVPDDWEERCEEPESKNLMEQDELLRKNGASSSQRTVDVFLNEATASDEPNFTEPRVECLGADSGSKPKAHSPSGEPLHTQDVEDADISHLQTSCANDDEPCTSPEAKATTNKTSRPSIPTPAAIENIFGPSQTLDSCYQELPKDWGKDWLPRRVPDVFSIKRFMNLKLPFYYVVYLIASLLQLLGKVHVKGILINSFSVENIRLFKIGGRLVLKISDPNMQATSMPLDLSNPMLERCQSDLIHTVKFCSEIITNYKGSKAVTGKDLDIYLGVFQIFKTDGIYSKCNAFINYFILISTNMKELHPLLKEYVKNPNFTFLYEGRNLHLFKETEHSCMHCILRIISQDIKMAPLNDIEYLRNNTVFGITDWKLHLDEHLVKDFEMGEKAKYSGKKVTNLFKFCKNVLSHLIERRNQYDDFSITLHRLGIHNDIDFMNYIESKIPKLPFHVFSGIYMYKRK
ncbi:hypothetical protein MAR_020975 [Mya arenaria]|uniref:KEN domain-containing protein n=1 Tax=Mya arenaria TaxID=6604 RepID=A0ABY7EEM0_MYAAR|nr:hypothetical protein MAR_020975 [Mya arenaria]